MKKVLIVLSVSFMLFALGCGSTDEEPTEGTSVTVPGGGPGGGISGGPGTAQPAGPEGSEGAGEGAAEGED